MNVEEARALVAAVDAAPHIARPWVRQGVYCQRTPLRSFLPALGVGADRWEYMKPCRLHWHVYHPTERDQHGSQVMVARGTIVCARPDPTDEEFAEAMKAADEANDAGGWWVLA